MTELKTPLGDEILKLKAGDRVTLSGTIHTARDEAHIKMQKEGIPFDPNGAVIYHCGPVIKSGKIIVAGPTTSARMNSLTGFVLENGVSGLIGKGGMNSQVREMLKGKGVYFAFTGGCAPLAASHMKLKGCRFEELGMAEAVWEIELNRLPLVVAIDAHGNDIYSDVQKNAQRIFELQYSTKEQT